MNWYTSALIETGLALLTGLILKSRLSPEKKAAFTVLMASVHQFIAELSNPTPAPPVTPPAGIV